MNQIGRRWRRTGSEILRDVGILRLRKDLYEHGGRRTHPFYVLEAPAWVNVVAITPGERILLVRQYRHGTQEETLEVPGGAVDPEDGDPATAAARELLEETGHQGDALVPLGAVTCNPAILSNRTYTYLARNVRRIAEPRLDENEDLTLESRPVDEIPALIRSGEIHHALTICALAAYLVRRA